MINDKLINPNSIAIIGGSNDTHKPGGKIVENIISGNFNGNLFVVNPKQELVQGLKSYSKINDIPNVDLAIIVIPAKYCLETIEELVDNKQTRAFIVLSAGFGELNEAGKDIEEKMADKISSVGGTLIGPNCIGIMNQIYHGVFTKPIPKLHPSGVDFVSSSGSTAVFLMEEGISLGLRFANIFTLGNSAQTNIEDVLEYLDISFDKKSSSKNILLYIENISYPKKFYKHCSSLINKGCRIGAIKAGITNEGGRAASSHTGALMSSELATRALFRKSGVVFCSSREELLTVGSIFTYKELTGPNIAIISHAGGTGVMLTDSLIRGGLKVPLIEGKYADTLLSKLDNGSSVKNPIDFLATGTAEQLDDIIDYCGKKFDHIDGMVVVFGSPGLFKVTNAYNIIHKRLGTCQKPIFPVLPSIINAHDEIDDFVSKGHVNFPDEVVLGTALSEVYKTPKPAKIEVFNDDVDRIKIREIINNSIDGYLSPNNVAQILDSIRIPRVKEYYTENIDQAIQIINNIGFPIVMKVVGPIHKSDSNGVIIDIRNIDDAKKSYLKLMKIESAKSVLIQPLMSGIEIFLGSKKEGLFGHLVFVGLGGIFIEAIKDFSADLVPINNLEAKNMINRLRSLPIIRGIRGKKGLSIEKLSILIQKLSLLMEIAPEIIEMDINPLMGYEDNIYAVDARILIEK